MSDERNAPLPRVVISVIRGATGLTRTLKTGVDGRYRFPSLPVGTYDVTAELPGYASVTVRKVEISLAMSRVANVRMRHSEIAEEITVTAPTTFIDIGPVAVTIVNRDVTGNVPLREQQSAELATFGPMTTLLRDQINLWRLTIGVAGGRGRDLVTLLDGGAVAEEIPIDAIEQLATAVHQYPAEYGRSAGGVLLMATKQGSSQYDGDAFILYRDRALSERTERERLANSGKERSRRWHWGAAVGGPITEDRLHFFVAAEQSARTAATAPESLRDDRLFTSASFDASSRHFLSAEYTAQRIRGRNGVASLDSDLNRTLLRDLWYMCGDLWNELFLHSGNNSRVLRDDLSFSLASEAVRHDLKAGASAFKGAGSAFYLQDDVVTRKLTLNIGVRHDRRGAFSLDQTSNRAWQAIVAQSDFHEPWLREFQNGGAARLDFRSNSWSPRIAWAYDVNGGAHNIIRGGFGRYYGRSPIARDRLVERNDVVSPTVTTPHADHWSVGYSWQINPWMALNFDAARIVHEELPFVFRANRIDSATGVPRFQGAGDFRLWYGRGRAQYSGLSINGHTRLGTFFDVRGSYTFSRTRGNVLAGVDDVRLTAPEDQPDLAQVLDESLNPADPLCRACFGPLDTDARHRVAIAGLIRLPGGFSISGVVRYRSATPYTEFTGVDRNGDGFAFDLPDGVTHVNAARGSRFSQTDIRGAKTFHFERGYDVQFLLEVFNVLNERNASAYHGALFLPDAAGVVRSNDQFGRPTRYSGDPFEGEQRLAQLGLRVTF